jgi:low affinity Fe/Cu permease
MVDTEMIEEKLDEGKYKAASRGDKKSITIEHSKKACAKSYQNHHQVTSRRNEN